MSEKGIISASLATRYSSDSDVMQVIGAVMKMKPDSKGVTALLSSLEVHAGGRRSPEMVIRHQMIDDILFRVKKNERRDVCKLKEPPQR